MKVPNNWIDEIVDLIKSKQHISFLNKSEDDIRACLNNWLQLPYNETYYIDDKQIDKFQYFFINVVAHQLNRRVHPLTCGVDSNHDLLVPRIDYHNNCYLICPTCCYVQTTAYLY